MSNGLRLEFEVIVKGTCFLGYFFIIGIATFGLLGIMYHVYSWALLCLRILTILNFISSFRLFTIKVSVCRIPFKSTSISPGLLHTSLSFQFTLLGLNSVKKTKR